MNPGDHPSHRWSKVRIVATGMALIAVGCVTSCAFTSGFRGIVVDEHNAPIAGTIVLAQYNAPSLSGSEYCNHVEIALTGSHGEYSFPARLSNPLANERLYVDAFKPGYGSRATNARSWQRLFVPVESPSQRFQRVYREIVSMPRLFCGRTDGSNRHLYPFDATQLAQLEALAVSDQDRDAVEIARDILQQDLVDYSKPLDDKHANKFGPIVRNASPQDSFAPEVLR